MSTTLEHPASPNNRILLVDDDPSMLRLLSRWLEDAGYQVRRAGDGGQALEALEAECPDFLVTDWDMPNLDGLELCRRVRQLDLPYYLYILFLTARSTSNESILGLEQGADDFLPKPVAKAELLARLHAGGRRLQLERRLREIAHSDPLTGLLTRRTFFEAAAREWERTRRSRRPVSCVMVDIDFFKRINDTHGHVVGDTVLRAVARELAACGRKSDLICRFGGEEFCALLPETKERDAATWAERARQHVAATDFPAPGGPLRVTCSFGTAQNHDDTQNCEQLVDQADQALLCAKRSGRDRVVRFESLSDAGEHDLDERSAYGGLFAGITAADVMTPVVVCLREDESVGRAAEFFLCSRINSAPVVDREGRLCGIVSEKDLMVALTSDGLCERPVRESMKPNVICYPPETPIRVIYEFLCRVAIRRVVIAVDGSPLGTISRATLLRWFRNLALSKGLLDSPRSSDSSRFSCPSEPTERLAQTARELAGQIADLERRLDAHAADLASHVVGGVSRMQDLLDDLLAHARYANRPEGDAGTPESLLFSALWCD